jgi:septal ring factor EnvC (AmiA/AmiB activator)
MIDEATSALVAAVLTAIATISAMAMRARIKRDRMLLGDRTARHALDSASDEADRDAWRKMWRAEIDRVLDQLSSVTAQRDCLLTEVASLRADVQVLRAEVSRLQTWRESVQVRAVPEDA